MKTNSTSLPHQAYEYLLKQDYPKATELYEQAIEAQPEEKSNYWHLGLLFLLQGEEEQAHTTWLLAMVDEEEEQLEHYTGELVGVLKAEAQRQQRLGENSMARLIRQHLREISPTDLDNLFHLVKLAIEEETLDEAQLQEWEILEQLEAAPLEGVDSHLLVEVLEKVFEFAPLHPCSLELAEASVSHLRQNLNAVNLLIRTSAKVAYRLHSPAIAILIAQLALQLDIRNPVEILRNLAGFYLYGGNHAKGIEIAKQCFSLSETLPDKIFANYLIIKGLMGSGGYWEEAWADLEKHESMLLSLIEDPPSELHRAKTCRLLSSTFLFPYFRDDPQGNRKIWNQVGHLFQSYLYNYAPEKVQKYARTIQRRRKSDLGTKKLKVGYISTFLRSHSVGWLARGLFQHHDRDRVEVYGYFINCNPNDPLQQWYFSQVNRGYQLGSDCLEIADRIYEDEIDIAIDLDSLTLDATCEVMALKPAPVQVTWLGWDASGIPGVDYFIADPYVLPDRAGDYYSEKIWRLPETYIAVDGFEVGVPTLRRDKLEIPSDAIVYYSGQTGYKRHPETTRLQMKILKAVPNSYFLIKGKADEEAVKNFFIELAEEEGVNSDRLRFLPQVPSEAIHRANLAIADVVLDTYPYNGATTTLETLWMGIPIVTRVGEQFAARNSYTMMVNAGVIEGIARSDEEYLDWGIRLGKDADLRQEIYGRLRRSRHSSPLWNAEAFTREMESAYKQMWQSYLNGKSQS
jgi:predicted O-linked N-acetylglucosamine transferase (SPINDLY family)